MVTNEPVYTDIGRDEKPIEVQSICTSCYEQGITKILLTKIPMFREIIITSFACENCGFSNNELQPGTPVQTSGIRFVVCVKTEKDLNRMVVRAEKSSFRVSEVDFEAPPTGGKGVLTTIEGLLTRSHQELTEYTSKLPTESEPDREHKHKFVLFLTSLQECISLKRTFTFVLDDPAGNSFVEQYDAPAADPNVTATSYERSLEQNKELMVENVKDEGDRDSLDSVENGTGESEEPKEKGEIEKDEILSFSNPCPSCSNDCTTNIKTVSIPYFKEVLLMATNCDDCGYRTNEVKPAKGISEKGVRYELNMTSPSDLTRDILKTHDAIISIEELELSMGATTLGGKFTTVEGIISNIREQIISLCPFTDSSTGRNTKLEELSAKLQKIKDGEMLVKIIMDDPSGNSYIQNFYAPDPDPEMLVVHYERSKEQNEELGIDQMKTEDYEEAPK